MAQTDDSIRQIIRVKGADLNGLLTVERALIGVRGIGKVMARIIRVKAGLDSDTKMGILTDAQLKKIEDILDNPQNYGIEPFLLNRQKDFDSGVNKHLSGVDLDMGVRGDIALMKSIRSYKGVRHSAGLKVRGQRTKSTGRKGAATGVVKKKVVKQSN